MIDLQIKSQIAEIRLNRPEKRNAFNPELVAQLTDAVVQCNEDPQVRVLLFKGEGEAFSAGADLSYLKDLQSFSLQENEVDSARLAALFEAIYHSPKLTVAWVDGFALAGGCGLASIMDHCYASPESKFGYTEVRIGFIPAIVMVYLQYKLNEPAMNRLILDGEIISAEEAMRIGLIREVVDTDGEEFIHSMLQKWIATTSGQAVAATKKLQRAIKVGHQEAIQQAIKANAIARGTDDCKRGIQAFLDKTKLDWT